MRCTWFDGARVVFALLVVCAVSAPAGAQTAAAAGKIPITSSSEEARALYLKGRDLAEKLRATDARRFYEQAAAKDTGFALAYVGLANTSGTNREFVEAVTKAVGPRAEGERRRTAHGARARRRAQERPRRRAAPLHGARGALSEGRARADAAREHLLRAAGVPARHRPLREGHRDQRRASRSRTTRWDTPTGSWGRTARPRPRSRSTSSSSPTTRTRTTRMPNCS